jgi:hypothetical protein
MPVPAIPYNKSSVEEAALTWLQELGYAYLFGPDIASVSAPPSAWSCNGSPISQ